MRGPRLALLALGVVFAADFHGARQQPLAPDVATAEASLPKLALATLAIYPTDSTQKPGDCNTNLMGMLGWCQGAQRLANALSQNGVAETELVILTNQSTMLASICPGAKMVTPEEHLAKLVKAWAVKHGQEFDPKSNGDDAFTLSNSQKVQFLGLTEYDALLFSDGDVMLTKPEADKVEAAVSVWKERLPTFLKDDSVELMGGPDWSAPEQGGLWLVKPSKGAYEAAAGVYARGVWNVSHGFDLVGTPQMLAESIKATYNDPQALFSTQWYKDNNWHCVDCGTDQGLLFYVFHILLKGKYRQSQSDGMSVLHWWAHPKPWEVVGGDQLAQRLEYFSSLELDGKEGPCHEALRAKLNEARKGGDSTPVSPNVQNVLVSMNENLQRKLPHRIMHVL